MGDKCGLNGRGNFRNQGREAVSCDLEVRHFSHGARFSNREE
jgi:hypothetical protein